MADASTASDAALAEARAQALIEAASEARRLARTWRDEAEDNHSGHHSTLRRTWADGAERVADAIEALARQGGTSGR